MFDSLSQRLARIVKTMRGEARLTEANTQEMLREIRIALLEADVALPVVRDFIGQVKEKALGQEVLQGINRLEVGRGLMAGVSIVVLAILFDRITQGYGRRQRRGAH